MFMVIPRRGLGISYGPFDSRKEAVNWAHVYIHGKYSVHVMVKPHFG